MATKPTLAMYWAAACGGCEVAVLNLHERLLELDATFDLVFCPCLLDVKRSEVEAMPDASIAVTLFDGAIRNDENLAMARLLRRKSRLLVAFGACAAHGGVPGLSNLCTAREHLATAYLDGPTVDNPAQIIPLVRSSVGGEVLDLPAFHDRVVPLAAVVDVDYVVPGCPPEPAGVWSVVETLSGAEPPPRGTVLGAGTSTVCQECSTPSRGEVVDRLVRRWEVEPDPGRCLMDQGIVCLGLGTRGGCGALCPGVGMPCTGCYGPPEGVRDQSGKLVSAIASRLDVQRLGGMAEAEILAEIDEMLRAMPDPVGALSAFTVAGSLMRGSGRS